jgi:hypothetical protein
MRLVSIALLAVLGCSSATAPALEEQGSPTAETETGPQLPTPPRDDAGLQLEDGAVPADETGCVATRTLTVPRQRHSTLLLLDRSGSMLAKTGGGVTRWRASIDAIANVLGRFDGGVVEVGLDLFPRGDAPVTCCEIDASNGVACRCPPGGLPGPGARCDARTYARPLVGIAAADDAQRARILGAMEADSGKFYWGTPTKAALQAALAHQRTRAGDGARSVILVSDGEPSACSTADDDFAGLLPIAEVAARGTPPVRTYVVGITNPDLAKVRADLSRLALAGGTPRAPGCDRDASCFHAIGTETMTADLARVFDQIDLRAFDCRVALPTETAIDRERINVRVETASGSRIEPRDPTKTGGWDYDADGEGLRIHGPTCTALEREGRKIDVEAGCATLIR